MGERGEPERGRDEAGQLWDIEKGEMGGEI